MIHTCTTTCLQLIFSHLSLIDHYRLSFVATWLYKVGQTSPLHILYDDVPQRVRDDDTELVATEWFRNVARYQSHVASLDISTSGNARFFKVVDRLVITYMGPGRPLPRNTKKSEAEEDELFMAMVHARARECHIHFGLHPFRVVSWPHATCRLTIVSFLFRSREDAQSLCLLPPTVTDLTFTIFNPDNEEDKDGSLQVPWEPTTPTWRHLLNLPLRRLNIHGMGWKWSSPLLESLTLSLSSLCALRASFSESSLFTFLSSSSSSTPLTTTTVSRIDALDVLNVEGWTSKEWRSCIAWTPRLTSLTCRTFVPYLREWRRLVYLHLDCNYKILSTYMEWPPLLVSLCLRESHKDSHLVRWKILKSALDQLHHLTHLETPLPFWPTPLRVASSHLCRIQFGHLYGSKITYIPLRIQFLAPTFAHVEHLVLPLGGHTLTSKEASHFCHLTRLRVLHLYGNENKEGDLTDDVLSTIVHSPPPLLRQWGIFHTHTLSSTAWTHLVHSHTLPLLDTLLYSHSMQVPLVAVHHARSRGWRVESVSYSPL